MFVPADRWYCCLTANEKAAVVSTAAFFAAVLNQPIPEDLFTSAWLGSTLYQIAGMDAVLYYYGLEHTVIVIPDEPPIPAIGIVNLPLWLDIDAFFVSGMGTCSDGCDEPTWSR